jgi:DNA-directed RNA polymerase specialized sigma subunit
MFDITKAQSMTVNQPLSTERRLAARWDHLSNLTGLSIGGKQTGWDRLAQVILDDPAVRLKSVRRMEAIVNLFRMMTRLRESDFVILALRLGLTVDDQAVVEQSRREVSEKLQLSVSRIAQLEHEAIEDLRVRVTTEFPDIADYVHRSNGGNGITASMNHR